MIEAQLVSGSALQSRWYVPPVIPQIRKRSKKSFRGRAHFIREHEETCLSRGNMSIKKTRSNRTLKASQPTARMTSDRGPASFVDKTRTPSVEQVAQTGSAKDKPK